MKIQNSYIPNIPYNNKKRIIIVGGDPTGVELADALSNIIFFKIRW